MIFIENPIFTKQLAYYLNDESYSELQNFLNKQPDAGSLIQGTGGLRKLRWRLSNRGKQGGVRIIYYWQVNEHHVYLMTIYAKNEMADLSAKEKKLLKQMLEEW